MSSIELHLAIEPVFRDDTQVPRKFSFAYECEAEGEEAAELAFHITNAPSEILTAAQREIERKFRAEGIRPRCLSVGDSVVVIKDGVRKEFLCKGQGWEELAA